ncbi:MAG: DNA replication and repair protein RecF [Paracoccaceae bacterium]
MAGLALFELSLSHFRSYRSIRLSFGPEPIAFFGANGAGKTNILEAVSLLSPGRGIRRAGVEEMARSPENLGWKLTANLQSLGHEHELETWAEPGSSRQVRIDGKAASQLALGKLARIVWLVPSMDRLWLEGAEGRRRFLDRMALSFFPRHAEATLAYDKAMRERNRLLKDGVSDDSWYRALEGQMAVAGADITRNRIDTVHKLMTAQQSAKTAFPTADLALLSREDSETANDADDFAQALARGRHKDMAAGRTLIGPHRADIGAVFAAKDMEAKLCSTGEQKALLISLILANARALAEEFGAPPIILLDEVAAHLDADRRAALYDEICGLKAQAWMTGTDASLFAALEGRAKFVEVLEGENGSVAIERDVI